MSVCEEQLLDNVHNHRKDNRFEIQTQIQKEKNIFFVASRYNVSADSPTSHQNTSSGRLKSQRQHMPGVTFPSRLRSYSLPPQTSTLFYYRIRRRLTPPPTPPRLCNFSRPSSSFPATAGVPLPDMLPSVPPPPYKSPSLTWSSLPLEGPKGRGCEPRARLAVAGRLARRR